MAKAGDKKVRYLSNTHDAAVNEERFVDPVTADRLVENGHAVLVADDKSS